MKEYAVKIMRLKELFKTSIRLKDERENYQIKWTIKFRVDDYRFAFFLLPTILVMPWPYRHPGQSIIDIYWFNLAIVIGKWERKN